MKSQDTKCSLLCSRLGLFMLIFSLSFYLESVATTYIVTAIQSIERQFQISSRTSGILVSASDIGYLPSVVILSYLGSKGNRARWIAFGCLLVAAGNMLICLSNFIFPAQISILNETVRTASPAGFCDPLRQISEQDMCSEDTKSTNRAAVALVFVALTVMGVGHSMPWSLGVPLLDDNVKKTNMPLYFSIFFVIKIFGPISTMFVGAVTSSFYVTLTTPAGVTRSDPRWIGAWWLGFLVLSLLLFGPAVALGCFTEKNSKQSSLKLVDRHKEESTELGFCATIQRLGRALLIILKSPIYTGAVLGRVLDAFAFKGFYTFLPKYFENHYGLPQYQANILIGATGLICVLLGVFGGGCAMRRLKLEGRKAALWVAGCSLLAVLFSLAQIFLGCHSVVNNIGQTGMSNNFNFTDNCNANCLCSDIKLRPVCSSSGEAYFSPCHAGCQVPRGRKAENCSCVDVGSTVDRSWCEDDCKPMIVLYIVIMILATVSAAMSTTPGILIVLRSVPAAQRSISIGVSAFVVSLGTMVAPAFFGSIIDGSCLLWEQSCSGKGACVIYEPMKMRVGIHGLVSILKGLALITDVWVWYWAKDLKLMNEEEDETQTTNAVDMNNINS